MTVPQGSLRRGKVILIIMYSNIWMKYIYIYIQASISIQYVLYMDLYVLLTVFYGLIVLIYIYTYTCTYVLHIHTLHDIKWIDQPIESHPYGFV